MVIKGVQMLSIQDNPLQFEDIDNADSRFLKEAIPRRFQAVLGKI